ncbi:MAG: DUF935 domain-containing protein [Rhodoblastus sp.]
MSLVNDDGAAIDAALLKGETAEPQTFGQRALVYHTEATGLTPERLAEILRGANMGLARSYLTLAIDMEERYLHYASQLQTRRLALDGVTISVSAPDGVNAKAVDAVQGLIDDPILRDMIQDMQDGLGKGYSVVEPIWDYQEGVLKPVVYQHRDPRYFRYDEVGLRNLHLLDESGLPGIRITAPYFIAHEPRVRAGVPIRAGLARSAAWAFLVQSFTLQDWAAFAEIYGIPFRVGKYGPSATVEDKLTLLRAVRGIANDGAAIIPAGMEVEFHEVSGARGEAVFGSLIDYLDRKISLAVVGQTMTAENGSSLGQAKVHNEVRHDIQRFDARATASTLNRDLIRPFVAMNFGPQKVYPTVQLEIAEPEDLQALGDFLQRTVPLGLKVGQAYARKKAGIPDPTEDDELLTPPARDTQRGPPLPDATGLLATLGGCACGCGKPTARLAAEAVDDDAVRETDEIVAGALDDWQEIADPLLGDLLAAVDGSASFEEVRAKLARARVDTDALVNKLSIATTISRGLGLTKG